MFEDSKIIDLYWNRSEQAITATSSKYGGYCMTISHNILYNHEDAKECVNDTYLHVWNAIPPKKPNVFKAFIGKICRNLSLDRYRHNRASKRGGDKVDVLLSELEHCLADSSAHEFVNDDSDITDAINIFLEDCSKEDRVIFVQRYFYCESIQEIAERFGFTEGKVKTRLFRMRQKLKEHLDKEGIAV